MALQTATDSYVVKSSLLRVESGGAKMCFYDYCFLGKCNRCKISRYPNKYCIYFEPEMLRIFWQLKWPDRLARKRGKTCYVTINPGYYCLKSRPV